MYVSRRIDSRAFWMASSIDSRASSPVRSQRNSELAAVAAGVFVVKAVAILQEHPTFFGPGNKPELTLARGGVISKSLVAADCQSAIQQSATLRYGVPLEQRLTRPRRQIRSRR